VSMINKDYNTHLQEYIKKASLFLFSIIKDTFDSLLLFQVKLLRSINDTEKITKNLIIHLLKSTKTSCLYH